MNSERWRRVFSVWFAVIGVALLAGCDDGAPDYRYRLTVEVKTPEGLKTGSSVIEVEQSVGRAGGSPANSQIYRKVRGEAVAVEMPDGRTLFALLRSESDNEWAETVMDRVSPPTRRGSDGPLFDGPLQLRGKADVPRTYPAHAYLEERSAYPMFVIFSDIDDPTSVQRVEPDDLAATFGEGVVLKRVTVELTNDPVTTGIEGRLAWLPEYYDKQLSGDRFQMLRNERKGLSAFLSSGVFSAGAGLDTKDVSE